jgi:uncharacterized protein (DUF983 family)
MRGMNKAPEEPAAFETWPAVASAKPEPRMPGWPSCIGRGILGRCPQCGSAPIFDGYLKVYASCLHCAAPLGEMPADDAPPYIAMLVVLHVAALLMLIFYRRGFDPGPVLAAVLLVILALVCMLALRMAKGAVIAILLKLGIGRGGVNG